ncbi:MAG TPA: glycoside hydrolase family 20 zincin-like fold domain-containing protein, partial [Cyclobacteriaceae bacterium]|nr:glycoside hydrolase family 20 zincin-like fold domain-containing protein [Cyclobacteriaceae bacterium]
MKNKFTSSSKVGILLFSIAVLISCNQSKKEGNTIDLIIPEPQSVAATGNKFLIKESTGIFIEPGSEEVKSVANYLASKLKPSTGYDLSVSPGAGQTATGNILISTSGADSKLGEEGYELTITEDQVKLVAPNPAGLFRGVQTIRQLLPAAVENVTVQKNIDWSLPTGTIHDYPNYQWRGVMLD